MQDYTKDIKNSCKGIAQTLIEVVDNNEICYKTYDIDCKFLKAEYLDKENITHADWFKSLFDGCHSGPTLYLVERIGETPSNVEILNLIKEYRSINIRGTSATKKHPNFQSRYLYIGKVKASFYGRIIQHLGFFSTSRTGGLQIFHWLQGRPMTIRFHAYHFPAKMANYMGILEYDLAMKFKPLIGKHK